MKHVSLICLILLLSSICALGQGTIRGKITDENGETIIGAAIVLKSKPTVGVVSDLDGNYSLKITDSLAQTLIISIIGYQKIEETIHPVNGQVLILNYVLKPDAKQINEVVITSKAVKSKDYYIENMKKKSAATLDYVSSESIKKTGDASVSAAISRVTGVSTNGNFITVRGIGDRYIKTAINGLRIPTLDPFTNNIKLDLFSANLVDNITITKTASPDIAGDWAGAYMSVQTKDFPEQLTVNFETTAGYNSQSTFNNVISSQRSTTDWLGYDNTFREHNHSEFTNAISTPTQYQEFVALGLGSYYNSLGVNQQNWGDGTETGETYFKLGLVQLGLLPPAQFDDQDAFNNAKLLYNNGPYKNQAFDNLNAGVPTTGNSFPNNWNTTVRKAPINFSQSFTLGNQVKLFKRDLGFIVGYRYGSSIVYDANSVSNRAAVAADDQGNLVNTVSSAMQQQVSKEANGWSALVNASYKINPNNSFTLVFMPNFTGVNNVLSSVDNRDSSNFVVTQSQFYEQRQQLIYQLKTEHYVPAIKTKIDFSASYTNGKSSAPDFKNVQYLKDPFTDFYQIGPEIRDGIHRYYRYLTDDLFDSQLSFEIPIKKRDYLVRKLKFGGAYQRNERKSDQYDYSIDFGNYSALTMKNDDLEGLFNLNNFNLYSFTDIYSVEHHTIDIFYNEAASDANHTFGNSSIAAGYIMTDYSITDQWRVSGGLRIENAVILTDVVKFDSLNYRENDPRRNYRDGLPLANPGKLNETSILPSVNVIYKWKKSEDLELNARFNFSQSIARPSIRELSEVAVFDYEYRAFVYGNSDLKMAHVNNYDLRLESYFKSGENISMSFFYKTFKDHIELVKSVGYSWQNVDNSQVAGIELEGRKKLWKNIDFRANISLIYSQTEFVRNRLDISGGVKNYIPQDTVKRSMYGQAPYVINGIVSYTADSLGLTATLSYNVQGSRLVIAADVKEIPDIYEQPRHLLDFKISKSIGKHFSVNFTVRDIFNAPVKRSYNYTNGDILEYDSFRYGTNYVLGFVYKI